MANENRAIPPSNPLLATLADPSRCDCCQAQAADNAIVHPLAAVEPWSARKSKRGRKKIVDSTGHFCPNPDCKYHQNPDPNVHALASNGRHGQQAIRQWREACQACGTYVSERHDTAMSNLKKPLEDVTRTLEMLNRGTSQADTAAHHRHDPGTIRSWLKRAAAQAMRVHEAYFQNLKLGNVQLVAQTLIVGKWGRDAERQKEGLFGNCRETIACACKKSILTYVRQPNHRFDRHIYEL